MTGERNMIVDFSSDAAIEEWLLSIPKFSEQGASAANFQLERMVRFCEIMDNPQKEYKTLHVAGTNGKGTVCRMLASVFQSAGHRTGLYTSPHLVDMRERFRVNSIQMESGVLTEFFRTYGEHITRSEYTFFELTTAIAFWYFKRMEVEVAIIETGLGGRLDATNVIQPELSVITSISMDHMDVLGDTLEEIAAEKAGIIKKATPVVTGNIRPEAERVIRAIAERNHSPFFTLSDRVSGTDKEQSLRNDIEATFGERPKLTDMQNAELIILSSKILKERFSVQRYQILDGFRQMKQRYPRTASFEKLVDDQNWFFDGAHNIESTEILIRQMISIAPSSNWIVVLSFMADKLSPAISKQWQSFEQVWLWSQRSGRAASAEVLKHYFPQGKLLTENPEELIAEIDRKLVIFSGSFYFYSIVRDWLQSKSAS